MNATKIAWFSRHSPTKRQRETLATLFGPFSLNQDPRAFASADQVIRRFQATGATELVIVAPLTIIRELCRRGIYPIVAKIERCSGSDHEAEIKTSHKHYRFVHFERIEEVQLKVSVLTKAGLAQMVRAPG